MGPFVHSPGSAIGQHLVDSSGEEIAIIIDVPRMKIDRQVTTRNDGFQTQQDRSDQSLAPPVTAARHRSEEHTSELQSLMRISYAVFCLKKKKLTTPTPHPSIRTQTTQ